MKRFLTVVLVACMHAGCFAQSGRHEAYLRHEGDNLYKDEQYALATEYYRELVNLSDQQPEILFRLAECYRQTFNYREAEAYYLKAYYKAPGELPLALYYYALMLKLNGSFEESVQFFDEFITSTENNEKLKGYSEQAAIDQAGAKMAQTQLLKSPYKLNVELLNTVYNDYAPALRDSATLVITSGRVASNRQAIDDRYGEGFTDNYYFVKSNGTWQDRTRQVFSITNTKYNEGSGCFNATGDRYYFTYCGKSNSNCAIYVSVWKEDKWSEPVALNGNINLDGSETKHPAVSKGGDTLMFSSNRPGGVGNYDIWMSVNSGDESWGPAINLGPGVNTKLNEIAPAFTIFPHIFFLASDGHQNYGGLDLYMAKRLSNGTIDLYNLDYPFNSNRDDCFITMTGQRVYFSSNRQESKGGFDIFSIRIPSIISFTSRLSLKSKGARGDVNLKGRTETVNAVNLLAVRNEDRIAYENLTYEKKKVVEQMIRAQSNRETISRKDFPGLSDKEFDDLKRIAENRFHVQELEQKFSTSLLSKLNTSGQSSELTITGVVKDSVAGGVVLANQKIILMDESGEVLKITRTNEQGKFRFTNVASGSTIFIRFERTGTALQHPKVEDIRLMNSGAAQAFENIYFDFDHYTLRPEAMEVLKDLAELLRNNTSAQVELYAYADDRGADDYNLKLTQKRGQAVLNYLTALGVDQTALAVIAKGKQSGLSNASEIQRQLNRRVEFYVNGAGLVSSGLVKTYLVKTKTTWKLLASVTVMDEHELKELNGATADEVQMFQPVRLPAHVKADETFFYSIR